MNCREPRKRWRTTIFSKTPRFLFKHSPGTRNNVESEYTRIWLDHCIKRINALSLADCGKERWFKDICNYFASLLSISISILSRQFMFAGAHFIGEGVVQIYTPHMKLIYQSYIYPPFILVKINAIWRSQNHSMFNDFFMDKC